MLNLIRSWFNIDTNVIVLGHTHYPFLWRGYGGTIIINPGSVGQPRNGNPGSVMGVTKHPNKGSFF